MAWTLEQEDWLISAIGVNRSYGLLARAFNERFNTNCTRNAILGKCSRLGIRDCKPDDAAGRAVAGRQRQASKPSGGGKQITVLRKAVPLVPAQTAVYDKRVSLREECDAGSQAQRTRRLGSSEVEELAKRREGFLPDISSAATDTSKPPSELGRMECKWPISDELACGAKTVVGSYCSTHGRLAYRVMPTIKRNKSYGH